MAMSFTTESMKQLFVFPFQDQSWKNKLVIGFLLSLTSIFIIPLFFLRGYFYEIQRRIIADKEEPSLPNWLDWGTLFAYGVRSFIVSLIYSIPILFFQLLFISSLITFPYIMESLETKAVVFPFVFFMLFYMLQMAFMIVYLIFGLASVMANSHMIANDDFAAAFKIKEWWAIFRNNIGGYLLSFVFIAGCFYMVSMISMVFLYSIVLCCIYPIITILSAFYLQIIFNVLVAQSYFEGSQKTVLQNVS